MARPRDNQKHISLAVEELLKSVARLVDSVGRAAGGRGPSAAGGLDGFGIRKGAKAAGALRGRADKTTTGKKIGSAVAAAWARLTPKERKARIAKMHAWRKAKSS